MGEWEWAGWRAGGRTKHNYIGGQDMAALGALACTRPPSSGSESEPDSRTAVPYSRTASAPATAAAGASALPLASAAQRSVSRSQSIRVGQSVTVCPGPIPIQPAP